MACHQICEVAERLRRVFANSDVNMYPAHMLGVAFRASLAEFAEEFLQVFDVLVSEDWRYEFALCGMACGYNADISLKFPFASLSIPCAPCIVSVSCGCVLVASRSKEVGGDFRGIVAGYVVHFNFNPDCLVFEVLDLRCCGFFHFRLPLSSCVPFGVCTLALKRGKSKLFFTFF